jgi:hypothetical protein
MKKRFLPIGLFSVLLFVLSAFLVAPAGDSDGTKENTLASNALQNARDYLAMIRNNQHSGKLNPADVIKARQQKEALANYKSTNSVNDLNWIEMGPDNIGGRVRGVIFDNRDASANTLYAGGVSGGLFKSTNLGSTWQPINQSGKNLNVTCMLQDAAGTIYVGTGEGLNTQSYSAFAQLGYDGGFIGQGIYKSVGDDNFQLVPGTEPVINGDTIEWAYINKLALDPAGNRLFAATHTGLKYATLPALNDWQSNCKYQLDSTILTRHIMSDSIIVCDSFKFINDNLVIYGQTQVDYEKISEDTTNINVVYKQFVPFTTQGNCFDVQVGTNGWIISTFNGFIYVSASGNPQEFVNRSVYPNNQDSKRKDMIDFSTNIIIRDKSGAQLHNETKEYTKEFDWHVNYVLLETYETNLDNYPSSANTGRVSLAIAPSDQNVVYMMATKSTSPANSLMNVYMSTNKGQTWSIIGPGGGTNLLNILGYYYYNASGNPVYYFHGDFSNTLTVFPNDPNKILAGGVNLWEGTKVGTSGYYQWLEKSIGDATFIFNGTFNPFYCHPNHHLYVFRPGYNDQFVAATDGGMYSVSISGSTYTFQSKNKNLNVSQFYSLDIAGEILEVIGGTEGNGTQYISGKGNTPQKGEDLWRPANLDPKYPEGSDGGFTAISSIRSVKPGISEVLPPSFYTKSPLPKGEALVNNGDGIHRMRRSESLGYDWSPNFLSDFGTSSSTVPVNTNFLTPMVLWESYSNLNSKDSVNFVAEQNYNAGDNVTIRSKNMNHPFGYILPVALNDGDSIMVQDIISTKLFFATKDNVYMTLDGIRFNVNPDWFKISAKTQSGFSDNPSCIAYSSDANYIFVGNYEGKVYRISNIANAYNQSLADVGSANCIIATTLLEVYVGNTQAVTSIAVDPNDANKVLVTLGNYGNTDYVYYSTNALGDVPVFNSVQGVLPTMPVYASVLEMDANTDVAIIGTEEGIWKSDNVSSGDWYEASEGLGSVPVMALKQQTKFKESFTITTYDPVSGDPSYEIFTKINNYGMIYAATFGRGIFRDESFKRVGIDEFFGNKQSSNLNVSVFPNPATSGEISLNVLIDNQRNIQVNIFDLNGKINYSRDISGLTKGKQTINLNVNSLSEGTYLLQVIAQDDVSTVKLVIVK